MDTSLGCWHCGQPRAGHRERTSPVLAGHWLKSPVLAVRRQMALPALVNVANLAHTSTIHPARLRPMGLHRSTTLCPRPRPATLAHTATWSGTREPALLA